MADYSGVTSAANKMTYRIVMGIAVATVALIVGVVWWQVAHIAAIDTFEECAAKYPVMESYPEQCRTPDGRIFTAPLRQQ
jgi:hypothetical protein